MKKAYVNYLKPVPSVTVNLDCRNYEKKIIL